MPIFEWCCFHACVLKCKWVTVRRGWSLPPTLCQKLKHLFFFIWCNLNQATKENQKITHCSWLNNVVALIRIHLLNSAVKWCGCLLGVYANRVHQQSWHHKSYNLQTLVLRHYLWFMGLKKENGWILPLWWCVHSLPTHICSNTM